MQNKQKAERLIGMIQTGQETGFFFQLEPWTVIVFSVKAHLLWQVMPTGW